jgi:hypothetical protein
MSKFKKWDWVHILWEDSYQLHGWSPLDETGFDEDESLGHETLGFYIGETKRQITVCQSKKSSKELDDAPHTNVNAVFSIPKSCILKIEKLPTPINENEEAK